ncbi:MAG TPA: glycosyltransferase, partial [Cellulomonas sp.]|nr:glycosyltransferase [Cellulomonas sp.]
EQLPPEVQLVLCAGAPDTPAILAEVTGLVDDLRAKRSGVVWIEQMLPREDLIAVLAAGTVFACPSVYEPLGIVNLEAMAVGLPVVGTATGGIPEVVDDGVTGWLVPIDQVQDGTGTPIDPDRFVADLAAALAEAVGDPDRAHAWGLAARRRVEDHFSWDAIAARTLDVYRAATA